MTTQLAPAESITLAPDNNPSTAYEASRVIKVGNGILFGLSGYNSGAAQFIQLHDAAALPADAAVPVEIFNVPTGNFSIDFGVHGKKFGLGIVVCNSSTGPTKTIGAANCWFSPRFK